MVSTAAFHARVRGSVPGLGGLKETKMFLPHPRVKVSIVGSLRDREVACSASDRQGSNFESCVWRTVSSQSSHHPQEVLLAQFSLYVHKGGLKPDSFHFISSCTLFKELSWETLSQRRENRRILMFSDIVHHRSPTYLQDLLPGSVESRSGHRYNLRNSDLMDTFSCRTETFKSSFFPYSTIFWNNLDENLKAIDERSILKSSGTPADGM